MRMKAWVFVSVLLCAIALTAPFSADCEDDYEAETKACETKYGMFDGQRMYRAGTCQ